MTDEYPEHEKQHAIHEKSHAIGEFLDYGLPRMGLTVCEFNEECDEFFPTHRTIQTMLAEWFGIDLDAIEREKREMIESLREVNTR